MGDARPKERQLVGGRRRGAAGPGALTRDDWVHSVHEDLSVRMRPAYLNKYIPHTINTEFDRFQEKQ